MGATPNSPLFLDGDIIKIHLTETISFHMLMRAATSVAAAGVEDHLRWHLPGVFSSAGFHTLPGSPQSFRYYIVILKI
ncbi:hypothetical protein KUTeg_001102 [Tegillarca granosa]|uniref:Uncharacterized protein n=1 Tax=Tegillarca granosa TaxID=220873 RepID=A0ABQ9FYZ5_TEGGR|nr:hypothetical protein KUTeg_001102 [Tegillarca granosa]